MDRRVFKVGKSTSNVTDDTITIKGAELPSTITVWETTTPYGHKLFAAVTIDVGTITIWGPFGEELGTWDHRALGSDLKAVE